MEVKNETTIGVAVSFLRWYRAVDCLSLSTECVMGLGLPGYRRRLVTWASGVLAFVCLSVAFQNRVAAAQPVVVRPPHGTGRGMMLPSVSFFLGFSDPRAAGDISGRRWLALKYFAVTPQGNAFLRACLASPKQKMRLLGLDGYTAGQFSGIFAIVRAATSQSSGVSEIRDGVSDIRAILGFAPNIGFSRASSPKEVADGKKRLLAWVKSHQHLWDREDYLAYWSGMFRRAVLRWNNTTKFNSQSAADIADGILFSWGELLAARTNRQRNIDAAVKLLPPYLTLKDPSGGHGTTSPAAMTGLRRRLYADMVWPLQLVTGPIFPESIDVDGRHWRANITAFQKWWRLHRRESLSEWLFASLAARGYATNRPSDVKATVRALILALRSRARGGLDRAAAALALNTACPNMPALITPPPSMSRVSPGTRSLVVAAMYHDSIAAAIRWYFRYAGRAVWDRRTAKYHIMPKSKSGVPQEPAPKLVPGRHADRPPPGGIREQPRW